MESSVNCELFLHTDDSALVVSGKSVIQIEQILNENLTSLHKWLVVNKLLLHFRNTESILFVTKQKLKKNRSRA